MIKFELFDDADQSIEYVKINTPVGKGYIRGSSKCDYFVFYEKNNDYLVKYFQKESLPNLQFIIKDSDQDMKEQVTIHLIAFKSPPEGRILSEGSLYMYFSSEPIEDDQVNKPMNANDYFLYIGLPIILLIILILFIILIIYIVKLKKKNKENKEKSHNKADQKKSGIIQQDASKDVLITGVSGKNENQQEHPVMNHNESNQPKIIYGAPPQNNPNQQIIYVMPESQMNQFQRNSNMPNFAISNNTGTTNASSDPRFSNMPSNIPSNFPNEISGGHYGQSDPFKNNLKLENPNDIPMFEVNMKEADDYIPGQKFQ